jgi:hypothetical protein
VRLGQVGHEEERAGLRDAYGKDWGVGWGH